MKKQLLFTVLSILISFFSYAQIPTNGLVGYYELDNGTYTDSSPSGFDLEVFGLGGVLLPVQNRFGQSDRALLFLNEYMDLASNPTAFDFDSDSNFSLCVWMEIGESIVDWTGLLNNWNGAGAGGYYLGINPTQGVRWNVNGPTPVDSATIPTGEWTHIAATYNGVDASLYVNGVVVGTATNGTPIAASPRPFTVAAQADLPTLQFPGKLDEILVYDRELSSQEILDIFSVLSIEDVEAFSSQVKVFPNPAESSVTIAYDRTLGTIISYELTDLQGRSVLNNELKGLDNTIDLSSTNSGIYLLTFKTTDEISVTKKIIKE